MTGSTLGILRACVLAGALVAASACDTPPRKFDTPEQAVDSLVAAVANRAAQA